MKIICILLIITLCSCTSNVCNINITSVETLHKTVSNVELDTVRECRYLMNGSLLVQKDTIMESEEGIEWPAISFYDDKKLLFTAESSWQELNKVKRIVVWSPILKTKDGLGVGSSFSTIKSHINLESWKDFPDGIVGFKNKDNSLIFILDTEKYPYLTEGPLIISDIPESLSVESLILVSK